MMEKMVLDMLKEIKPENEFELSENFFRDGLLDSLDIIELISAIETKTGKVIDTMDLIPENFVNLDKIIALIGKYKCR